MTEQERYEEKCAAIISSLTVLKRSFEAARDVQHPYGEERHIRGIRAGLQIAIDAIDREIRLFSVRTQPVAQLESCEDVSFTQMGMEAAAAFDEGHKKS